jgi:hypothetical protein
VTDLGVVEGGVREHWLPGDLAWFEYHCLESYSSGDAHLWLRSHTIVEVIGQDLDADVLEDADFAERADAGMPKVYTVRFPDGHEDTVWEDELLVHPDHYSRPDPPTS